ncbi:MAG: TRAP transporter large permease [Deltaproteobacteria bacterium]|nr:TRAP transporter large permease [Deltaproteobacteria bacterium]
MSEITFGIVSIIVLGFFFLTGIEIAFAIGIIGFIGYACLVSFSGAVNVLAKDVFDAFTSYSFTVIPLFVLMGQVAYHSGTAKRLYDSAYRFVGHIPGGLAMTTVVGATVFKAMCGSTFATIVAFSGIAVPEMLRYGYSKKLATGLVATVGTLGILLPPSVVLIIFGLITEQSIGRLFLAGIVPGIMLSGLFMFATWAWVKANPAIAPRGQKFTWKERGRCLPDFIWVVVIFTIVIGGLMNGFFSPTEAGSIGLAAVLVLAVIQERFRFKNIGRPINESLQTACMVLMLIACSNIFGHFLTITNIPMTVAQWVAGLGINRWIIMIFIVFIYLIGGSFIDDLAFMILATPVFFPVILKLGFDPIWFAMVISITIMIGVVIPPVAIGVFLVKQITGEPLKVIYDGVYPFLVVLIMGLIMIFLFPSIATFLPNMLMGHR